jgi:hypothetical protein
MPCFGQLLQGQTVAERKKEIDVTTKKIDQLLAKGSIKAKVGPQGAITFLGLTDSDRNRMTDVCIYRQISRTGSASAKMALARAEQLAGRSVDKAVINAGIHSHDGGTTWHPRG